MILSLFLVLVGGYIFGSLFKKIKLPKIIGMIIYGIIIGPSLLNILSSSLLNISSIIRNIALVIIITRAGLNLNYKNILKMGLPAILISFIPATFEIIGVTIFSHLLLNITIAEGLLLGSVLAAVSPAIIVPRMIKLKEEGYSKISELILVGSSVDDVYVIVLFYAFLQLIQTNTFSIISIIEIPTSIILGILLGILIGAILYKIFKKFKINFYIKLIITLTISLTIVFLEPTINSYIKIATLLSVIAINIYFNYKDKSFSEQLEKNYKKLWFVFEILLFVLVGVIVDLNFALNSGIIPIVVLFIGLIFRMFATFLVTLFTDFNKKEKLFTIISYIPKATVQASIGGIALAKGLPVGNLVLTIAVLSILISAPLGAILIDKTYIKLLEKDLF